MTEIVELYNELFDGDVVWMGASDHPALFARFLAAAGTWMILEKDVSSSLFCWKILKKRVCNPEKLQKIDAAFQIFQYIFSQLLRSVKWLQI